MKFKRLVLLLIILVCLGGSHALADVRFAVLCDSRNSMEYAKCGDNNSGVSPTLGTVVEDILYKHRAAAVNLILFPGDMISGYFKRDASSVAECNRHSLTRWREILGPAMDAGIALRVTVGNHEILGQEPSLAHTRCGRSRPYTPQHANLTVFKEVLGDALEGSPGPASDMGLTYSFDLDDCHFVLLTAYTMYQNNSFSNETMKMAAG